MTAVARMRSETTMTKIARAAGRLRLVLGCMAATAAATLIAVAPAHAEFGLQSFSVAYQDAAGNPMVQAGAHADMVTSMVFNQTTDQSGTTIPDQAVKDVRVQLPAGFYGNPQAVPTCDPNELIVNAVCSPDSQVGVLTIEILSGALFPVPVYNMARGKNELTTLEANVVGVPVVITIAQLGDNRLEARISNINQALGIYSTSLKLWGVPADPAHDSERYQRSGGGPGAASGAAVVPYLSLPARCEPAEAYVQARSWQSQDHWVSADSASPALAGCSRLKFNPTIQARPVVTQADKPTGYDIDLAVPQTDGAQDLATPQLRKATVTLPEGVAISPGSAAGLEACSDAQLGLMNLEPAHCPAASKVGTVSIETPLLPDPLEGDIIIGSPTPENLFRLFIVAQGQGVVIKLAGVAVPDEKTGQITTTFDNSPQLPFSELHMHFKGGDRAPLANPQTCGTKNVSAQFTAWDGTTVGAGDTFSVSGCGGGFTPSVEAGTTNPGAGQFTAFTMTLRRNDGDDALSKIDMALPQGLLGILAGVPKCAEASAAAGSCNAESQLGVTTVESGSGGQPLALPGKVFLAGPYNGAPYSLSVVVRAVAGPYDLGTVVVRVALFIDPVDAHVTAISDPLPTILKGVPLRLRTVNLTLDRARFMRNPTSCAATTIGARLQSLGGAVVTPANVFQPVNCAALAFTPRLAMRLGGTNQTSDGKHPTVAATLTQPFGTQANLKKVAVTLPLSLALDPDNSQSDQLCSFEAGAKTIPDCPPSSIVGTAMAVTPVLDQPLSGPVYFIKKVRIDPKSGRRIKTLPTLGIVLRGGGITLVVRATSSVPDNEHLVATFDNIPDAPVSSFSLNLNGGPRGILVISGADICKSSQVAKAAMTAQSGKVLNTGVVLGTDACHLRVISKKVSAKGVTVKVGGLGAGKLTISGKGIRTTTRLIKASTVATIVAKRTGKVRPNNVKVSFRRAGTGKAKVVKASLVSPSRKK
jgi:hypothetical protein